MLVPMTRIFTLILLCISLASYSLEISLGIQGGTSMNNTGGADTEHLTNDQGQMAGALSHGIFGGQVGISLAIKPWLYGGMIIENNFLMRRGVRYDDALAQLYTASISGYAYQLAPLLAGYLPTDEGVRFAFFAGPTFTFPLGTINKTINYTNGSSWQTTWHGQPSYGIVLGFATQVLLGPGFFTFDLRFQMDFTSNVQEADLHFGTPIALQVGYSFYLYQTRKE
jgi:hypothetical protein